MRTVPLTKSDLEMHFEETLAHIKNGMCESGTISWERDSFGAYQVIAVVMIKTDMGITPLTIGDVNG